MKQILVTGSNGQLGSDIRELSVNYTGLNFLFTDIEELDLTDEDAVADIFDENNFDYCINCAGYTAVDKAEDEPEMALLINRGTVANLAENCKQHQTSLIHISTDYIFDGTNHRPYVETDPPVPRSVYGLSKLKGELAIEAIYPEAMIIRTSWLYSSYGHNFVKTMMRLSAERDSINVVADQVGTPTYSGDLAKTILELIASSNKSKPTGIYHFSNEGAISWYDFAQAVMQITRVDCRILPIESKDFKAKALRPFYSVLSKTKIKSDFGITIPYWYESLQTAILKIKQQQQRP